MVLGKYMRMLLIALDICLLAYIISHMVYRLLPVTEPAFWIGVIIEVGLAWLAYRYWMRARTLRSWTYEKTLTVVLIAAAIAWPSLVRFTNSELLILAAPSDLLFFFALLTLLIYSSYVIQRMPGSGKRNQY
ncbi:MAG: hypothetical protein JXA46_16010 [Dehalococcoidales bacterium]|nr:hypothetical protein [Dehalococcoidales bacterium]